MPGREARVDLFWKDSIQAHNTATERALSARMLPQDLLRAWPFYNSYCFDAVYLGKKFSADLP